MVVDVEYVKTPIGVQLSSSLSLPNGSTIMNVPSGFSALRMCVAAPTGSPYAHKLIKHCGAFVCIVSFHIAVSIWLRLYACVHVHVRVWT